MMIDVSDSAPIRDSGELDARAKRVVASLSRFIGRSGELDPLALSKSWRELLAVARDTVDVLPVDEAGKCACRT